MTQDAGRTTDLGHGTPDHREASMGDGAEAPFALVPGPDGTGSVSPREILARLTRLAASTREDEPLRAGLQAALNGWVDGRNWLAGIALVRGEDGGARILASSSVSEDLTSEWPEAAGMLDQPCLDGLLAGSEPRTGDIGDLSSALAGARALGAYDVSPIVASGRVAAALVLVRAPHVEPDPAARQALEVARSMLGEVASRTRANAAVRQAAHHIRTITAAAETGQRGDEELQARYALLCRGAEPGLWYWNLQSETIHLSPRWKAIIGYGAKELEDRPAEWFDRIHPDDADRVELELLEHLDGQSPRFESEHRLRHRDGSYRWVRVRGVAEKGDGEKPARIAGSLVDITDQRLRDDRTARDLMYHRLTGLPMGALLTDRIEQSMRRRTRRPDRAFAVLSLSLEGLGAAAERIGAEATEELLLTVGRRLASVVRPGDTVAHADDLQFAAVLDDVKSLQDATQVARRMTQTLRQGIPLGPETLTFAPAVGLALSRSSYETPDEILRDARIALRRARREGVDVQVFDAATKAYAQSIAELEGDLRAAFEARDLYLEYQPVVSLGDGRITGLEALLRWKHPERGPIPPSEFLPVAEEAGLLHELGHWVTERACRQMREWIERHGLRFPPNIAINVTESQLFDESFVARTVAAVEASGLDFKLVRFDVSEGTFMKDGPAAGRILRALTKRGLRVAVDDFGTGYSSLSYLHRYPIGALKIDRLFVSGSAGADNKWDVARTIIELAKILELEVIAEGIETREQFVKLRKLGCQQAQGYFFSGPVSPQRAGILIQEGYPLDLTSAAS